MRWIIGVPIAAAVTLALFFLMKFLIMPEGGIEQKVEDSLKFDIKRVKREETSPESELKRPDDTAPPPEPPKIDPKLDTRPNIRGLKVTVPVLNPNLKGGIKLGGVLDGDVQPIVRVPPQYPPRMAQRGIEGYVIVQFTIDLDGSVRDPKVVESSNSGFNSSALRTVLRWKYRPQIVDGEPKVRPGVRTRIEFKLEDNGRGGR